MDAPTQSTQACGPKNAVTAGRSDRKGRSGRKGRGNGKERCKRRGCSDRKGHSDRKECSDRKGRSDKTGALLPRPDCRLQAQTRKIPKADTGVGDSQPATTHATIHSSTRLPSHHAVAWLITPRPAHATLHCGLANHATPSSCHTALWPASSRHAWLIMPRLAHVTLRCGPPHATPGSSRHACCSAIALLPPSHRIPSSP